MRSAQERLSSISPEKRNLLELLLEKKERSQREVRAYPRGVESNGRALLPTSWAQQRLWFIDQLEGGSAAYNVPLVIRLRGELDQAALRMTLNALIQRHEVLRTCFVNTGGEPMLEIAASIRFVLQSIDLTGYAESEREVRLEIQKTEEARRPFDLAVAPPIRGRLLRLQSDEHVLLITLHHISCDAWSINVMLRELEALYGAFLQRGEAALSPLPIQYADYAQWQREWLRGDLLDRQLSYWRSHLEGLAPELELPTDRQRPAVQRFRGERVTVVLDRSLTTELNAFSRRYGLTLFMVIYAVWATLLSRLSGHEDIVIGTPVLNRRRPEFEGLVGLFVNTLALRIAVRGDLQIAEFLHSVKEVTLGAYDHQDMPFERLIELLRPERRLSRHPIFQVMFALQNVPQAELRLHGLTASLEYSVNQTSKFDLLLLLEELDDEIRGCVNYDADLFDRETVERWVACFTVLAKAMIAEEQACIRDLQILPEVQRYQVVASFNATQVAYPPGKLVHQLFEEQAQKTPAAIAVTHEERCLTYAELNGRANQLARFLRTQGVQPDQVVGICVERSLEMVVAMLGILKAGGAYLPLDPNYPTERLQHMLEDASPQLVLMQEKLKAKLPVARAQFLEVRTILQGLIGNIEENLPEAELGLSARNLLYVIYTSGSTGRPKGTAMSHHSMANLIEWHRRTLNGGEGQRVLQFAALSFDVAFQDTFSTLCTGGTLVLLNEWIRRDARALTEFLNSHAIQRMFVPPLMLQSLSDYSKTTGVFPKSLKDIITAGEQLRISPEISAFFKRLSDCRLHNHYGPTETHVVTALTLLGDPYQWPSRPSIGRPISSTQIYVLNEQRHPLPIGVTGEIYVGGAGVASGYLGRPELTAERFIANPFSDHPAARLYKTGDLGRWQTDGTIEYLGRNDDQVKIRGYRIELGEVEAELAQHKAVNRVAVVAREDRPGEKRLVAYVTLVDPDVKTALGVDDLRAHLSSRLPEYMVPSAFVTLEQFPLTASGKLNRRALPAPQLESYATRHYEVPQGEIEEILASIWQTLLAVERVGRQDNFFELGGHSLHSMKLIAHVREHLGVDLSVLAVFQHPTIEQMANAVKALRLVRGDSPNSQQVTSDTRNTEPPLEPPPKLDRAPLAFSQLQYWHLNRLGERPSLRQLATAIHLRGGLNLDALRRSAIDVVRRHSALRTRIVLCDGVPIQEILDFNECEIRCVDLTALEEDLRETTARHLIEQYIVEPVSVTADKLFEISVYKLRCDEHVLVVAMEHMISDAFSLNIMLRELLTAYIQRLKKQPLSLPEVSVQFADYATEQRGTLKAWIEHHGEYWAKRLSGIDGVRLPARHPPEAKNRSGWTTVPVRIDKALKSELREWARMRRTTVVMAVLTAYVGLLLRWRNTTETLIQFQTSGRFSPHVEHTIGFFSSALYLRLRLVDEDSFLDLMNRVAEEYYNAYAHADSYYMSAQDPRPEFARTSLFNWVPQDSMLDFSALDDSADAIKCCPFPFTNRAVEWIDWDTDPMMVLFDSDDGIVGGLHFPPGRFMVASMERFAHNFVAFLQILLRCPEERLKNLSLLL